MFYLPKILCCFNLCIRSYVVSIRMLYCSTSSQYRTTFLQVISCGRHRARGQNGHAEPSAGGRGLGLSRSFRGCSDVGLGTSRPAASLIRASGTFSGTGNARFRTGDNRSYEISPIAAASAPGSMTLHLSECSNSGLQKVSNLLEVPIELRSLRAPSSHKTQVTADVGIAVELNSNDLSLSTLSSKLVFPEPSEDSNKARNKSSNRF